MRNTIYFVLLTSIIIIGYVSFSDNESISENKKGISTQVTLPWTKVSCGYWHTAALKSNGTLWAWGLNGDGQLGDGASAPGIIKNTPLLIGKDTNWTDVSCGMYNNTIGLKSNGSLWGTGLIGLDKFDKLNVYKQLDKDTRWSVIARYIAIKSDGSLWTWGNKKVITRLGADSDWQSIAVSYKYEGHTLAIKTNGSLWAWGDNEFGQLGDGTNINKNTPARIGTDTNWMSVAAGFAHTVALKPDGSLWAWGANTYGQLGDGTNTGKNLPTRIGTDTNWCSISCGRCHTLAIKADGSLWAWGLNAFGQLGDGTYEDKNNPIKIGNDSDWCFVACGWNHTAVIKTNGSLWLCGANYWGQLGDDTYLNKNILVNIK